MPFILAMDTESCLSTKRKRNSAQEMEMSDASASGVTLKNGKIIFKRANIRRNQDIFDAAGGTFYNAVQDCSSGSKLQVIDQIFKNLNGPQTKLLVHAIEHIYRDKTDDRLRSRLERFTSKLKKDELIFLLEQANYLDNESLQKACSDLLAQDETYCFQDVVKLSPELARPIMHKRFASIDNSFLSVGGSNIFEQNISSVASVARLDNSNRYFVVRTHGQFFLYDMIENSYKKMPMYGNFSQRFLYDKREHIYFTNFHQAYSPIFSYQISTGLLKEHDVFFLEKDPFHLFEPVLNETGDKIMFCSTGGAIGLFDIETGARVIISVISQGEKFLNFRFNKAGDRIIVTSCRRIEIYDVDQNQFIDLQGANQHSFFGEFVHFNSFKNQVVFVSDNILYSCDIKTGECEQLFNVSEGQSVKSLRYEDEHDRIFIETGDRTVRDHHLFMYDGRTKTVSALFQMELHEIFTSFMPERAQINQANSRLLVQTNAYARIFDLESCKLIASFDVDARQRPECYLSKTGDIVLTRIGRDLFVYSIATDEQKHIFHSEARGFINVKLNMSGDKILIYTFKNVYLYDEKKDVVHVVWEGDENQRVSKAYFNKAENTVVFELLNQIHLYDIETGGIKGSFIAQEQERFNCGYLSEDEASLVIKSSGRLINWKISAIDILNQLNAEQLDFIQKASGSWQRKKPYIVKQKDESKLYDSLPDQFKKKRFFSVFI